MKVKPEDDVELLPCPFCGHVEIDISEGTMGDGSPWWYVECCSCSATAETVEGWNQRTPSSTRGTIMPEWRRIDGHAPHGVPLFACGVDREGAPCVRLSHIDIGLGTWHRDTIESLARIDFYAPVPLPAPFTLEDWKQGLTTSSVASARGEKA